MKQFLLLCALMLASTQAGAKSLADNVQARILPGWKMADGRVVAALELTLASGWKTYWRAPGDAGIPPVFDWSASRNLSGITVTWPTPKVFSQSGMRSIGYSDRVLFPLTIQPRRDGKPVKLHGKIDIGVCNEVCVPVKINLSHALNDLPTRPNPTIAAAMADRPYSAREAGLRSITCSVTPMADGLRLVAEIVLPPTGGREAAIVETGDPLIWASEPIVTRKGNRLTAQSDLLHASASSFLLDRSALRFTVLGRKHAVDIKGCGG